MRRTAWSETDPGIFTGRRSETTLGRVQTTASGHFIAFDAAHSPIGRYDSLASAQRSVCHAARQASRPLPRRARRSAPGTRPTRSRAATAIAAVLGGVDHLITLPRVTGTPARARTS